LAVGVDGFAVVVCSHNPAIVDPALADLDGPHAGDDGAFRQAAVSDHLAMAVLIDFVLVKFQPTLDLGLDRLAEQSLGSVEENLCQNIP